MSLIVVAVTKTAVCVVAPCVDAALSEQATVHPLPPDSIMLNYWLVGNPESTSGGEAPVRGVESY